jgi:hypothetical protein
MAMFVTVRVTVIMVVTMFMFVGVGVVMIVWVRMRVAQMDVELDTVDLGTFGALGVKMIVVQGHLPQFLLDAMKIDPQVEHRPHEHVAAEAAENIEVECVQGMVGLGLGLRLGL